MRPHILLTGGRRAGENGAPQVWLPTAYADAVWRAGGLPALAPLAQGADYAAGFHGLLLTGGVDPDPALYGQSVLNHTVEIDRVRDETEKDLFGAFLAAGKPVLGICRGIQALNVFLGGSLIQDLPAQRGLYHSDARHMVSVTPGHWMESLLGRKFMTNSSHHQAVDAPGRDLRVIAQAEDGVIEAVEMRGAPVWGVQWHPERMRPGQEGLPDHGSLFERFVKQCRRD